MIVAGRSYRCQLQQFGVCPDRAVGKPNLVDTPIGVVDHACKPDLILAALDLENKIGARDKGNFNVLWRDPGSKLEPVVSAPICP